MRNKLMGGLALTLCGGIVACSGADTVPSDPSEMVAQYFDVTNTPLPSAKYAEDSVESLTEDFGPGNVFAPLSGRTFTEAEITAEIKRAFAPGAERMDARAVAFVSSNLAPEQLDGLGAVLQEEGQLSIMRCLNDGLAATGALDLNECQSQIGSELAEESAAAMNGVVRQLRASEASNDVLVFFGSSYCAAQKELADKSSSENFTFEIEEAKLSLSDGTERTCTELATQREALDAEDGTAAEPQAAS